MNCDYRADKNGELFCLHQFSVGSDPNTAVRIPPTACARCRYSQVACDPKPLPTGAKPLPIIDPPVVKIAGSPCSDWKKNEGPKMWAAIHAAAGEMTSSEFTERLSLLIRNIGCHECKTEAIQYLKENPPAGDLFAWSVEWHNSVNRRIGKSEVTVDEALSIRDS